MNQTRKPGSTGVPAAIAALDRDDPLADRRDHFVLPDGIYLDGNSLGPMPATVAARLRHCVEQEWARGLVGSWNTAGWIDLPHRVAERLAPLLGTTADRVQIGDSTSIDLHKLLHLALDRNPDRRVIVTEAGNFPTDLYILDGVAQRRRIELRRVAAPDLDAALDDSVAVLVLSHVNYRSGARHALEGLTRAAHARGILVVWDLAHSAGALPLALDRSGADFAVGCGYKFLNGGPGAPAWAWVHPRHDGGWQPEIRGWFGHAQPFAFEPDYRPASGPTALAVGTPPILGLTALDEALKAFEGIDMAAVQRKSERLFDCFRDWLQPTLFRHGFELLTPLAAEQRGSQLSLRHDHAWPICRALIDAGVTGDHRPPDVLRFGLTPLYTRFSDLWRAAETLRAIMDDRRWDRPEYRQRTTVT